MQSTGGNSGLRSALDRDHREAHWRKLLADAASSSLNQAAFCRARGIEIPTFYWWKREIARRDAGLQRVRTASQSSVREVSLVPVRLCERSRDGDSRQPVSDHPIEIVLRGGRILRVAPGFDPDTLRSVIAALEESC